MKTSAISADTHVWACTPLVIEMIGASSGGMSGHRSPNISRLTSPCSCATPLDRPASRRPITAMLKRSSGASPGRCPSAIRSSTPTPTSAHQALKYLSISSRGNRSMPAGTGVWVVKMQPARTASMASG